MSDFFFDSSALVKRYLSEQGTIWVRETVEPLAGHTIWIAELTEVEAAAALAAHQRAPHGITRKCAMPRSRSWRCIAPASIGLSPANARSSTRRSN